MIKQDAAVTANYAYTPYLGSECGLNDNPVDDNQAACIDYNPED